MLTPTGPQMLEINCRFGDPETQCLMLLLKSDLYDLMVACCDGTLDKCELEFYDDAACVIVLAANGYPNSYPKGNKITGCEEAEKNCPNLTVRK